MTRSIAPRSPSPRVTGFPLPMRPTVDKEAPFSVMVVDDEPTIRTLLARTLERRGMHVIVQPDAHAALDAITSDHEPDVLLTDVNMPGMDGITLLRELKIRGVRSEVIVMTGSGDTQVAIEAVRAGAFHFLSKPLDDAAIVIVAKAGEYKRLQDRSQNLLQRLDAHERFGDIIGASSAMRSVYGVVESVARTPATVLILGESGTGKELLARAIHMLSDRAAMPFVPVNCGAIPEDLIESELFGHVRGAFSGAEKDRAGLFESADKGTVFLDEIGELPLAAQVKLLCTLQDGEIKRVGADRVKHVQVRVIAATNRELTTEVTARRFRQDLYYRLNVISVRVPALRERADDIPLLVDHFAAKYARRFGRPPPRIEKEAMSLLCQLPWPGNVRELEHAIERAVLLARGSVITVRDLSVAGVSEEVEKPATTYREARRQALLEFDRRFLRDVLARAEQNFSEAARLAGVDRTNLRRILKRAGIRR